MGLVREGLRFFEELPRRAGVADDVLLATDLHAGNVLRAELHPAEGAPPQHEAACILA